MHLFSSWNALAVSVVSLTARTRLGPYEVLASLGAVLAGAEVLAVSRTGDMAVSLNRREHLFFRRLGTLAQLSVAGGTAPREILKRVEWADWAPDGKSLGVSLSSGDKTRIEYTVEVGVDRRPHRMNRVANREPGHQSITTS
jgi:hypothetical protein